MNGPQRKQARLKEFRERSSKTMGIMESKNEPKKAQSNEVSE